MVTLASRGVLGFRSQEGLRGGKPRKETQPSKPEIPTSNSSMLVPRTTHGQSNTSNQHSSQRQKKPKESGRLDDQTGQDRYARSSTCTWQSQRRRIINRDKTTGGLADCRRRLKRCFRAIFGSAYNWPSPRLSEYPQVAVLQQPRPHPSPPSPAPATIAVTEQPRSRAPFQG